MPPVPFLDRPGRVEQLWPLSVEAYHALGDAGLIPEKTELLYGFVFNKMPKSPLHTAIAQRLCDLIRKLLPSGWLLRQEQPINCDDSEPEPDVAVIRGNDDEFWEKHPGTAELVIEVAVTSQDYDRDKGAAYASAGIKEFWIVLVPEQRIEVFSEPSEGAFQKRTVFEGAELAVSTALPGLALRPAELLSKPPSAAA